jgi:hypothetical protein
LVSGRTVEGRAAAGPGTTTAPAVFDHRAEMCPKFIFGEADTWNTTQLYRRKDGPMSDAVRNFLEHDKALCSLALERRQDVLLRAAELIRDAEKAANTGPSDPT